MAASRGSFVILVALVCAILAGCLTPSRSPSEPPVDDFVPGPASVQPTFDFGSAIVFAHDHSDPGLHTASYGFRLVGHNPLVSASRPGTPAGGYNEISIGTNLAVVANHAPNRVFSVVNISDPANPLHLSDWVANDPSTPTRVGATSSWGVAIFPEDDLVIVSLQLQATPLLDPARPGWGGVFLVDLRDPTSPRQEYYQESVDTDALFPFGVHTVRTFNVENRRHVTVTTVEGQTTIYEVVGDPGSRSLRHVSAVKGQHDTAVQIHPITGQRLLYGALGGVYITDITDPAKPEIISFVPNGTNGLEAYHQVVPSDVLIGGRHFAVATNENPEGPPSPFTLLDTTDPADPQVVGQWYLPLSPSPPTAGGTYRFTGHNVDFDRGRIYIGHNHGGVWVIDVSTPENAAKPFPIAFYQPHEEVIHIPVNQNTIDTPAVWGAVRHTDGFVYAGDGNTGLYVLEVTEPPSPLEWAPQWPHNQH